MFVCYVYDLFVCLICVMLFFLYLLFFLWKKKIHFGNRYQRENVEMTGGSDDDNGGGGGGGAVAPNEERFL